MAYFWKIPFMGRSGVTYEIRIPVSYSGATEDIYLTAAVVPFVINEDDDDYMFKPVRTQSGYIRIVDTGSDATGQGQIDWHDLIPDSITSHPVTVYNIDSNYELWSGFMRPEVFESDFEMLPQERAFPIICPLSALEAYGFMPDGDEPITLAEVLYNIFYVSPDDTRIGDTVANFVFQGEQCANDTSTGWLYQRVSPALFLDIDEGGNRTAKYNCLEVLEYLCQYFGLTARYIYGGVWFVSPSMEIADEGFTWLTDQDLESIMQGNAVSPQTSSFATSALTGEFIDTDNTEMVVPGLRQVVVEEDVAKIGDLLSLPLSAVQKQMLKTIGSYGAVINTTTRYGKGLYTRASPTSPALIRVFDGVRLTLPSLSAPTPYLYDYDDDAYTAASGGTLKKTNYNWTPAIPATYTSDLTGYQWRISSLRPISISDAVIVLSLEGHIDALENNVHKIYNGYGTIALRIRIGDKYATLYSWRTGAASTVNINFGGDAWGEGAGSLNTNRLLDGHLQYAPTSLGPYPPFTGFAIPVPSEGVSGIMSIDLVSYTCRQSGYDTLAITSLKVEVLRGTAYADWKDADKNIHRHSGADGFIDEKNISQIFTTDNNNTPGDGILISPSGRYCEELYFGDGNPNVPGEELAEGIANYYSRSRRILRLNRPLSTPSGPDQKITFGGKTYYPLSVGIDYADNRKTIKLIEL